MNVTLCSSFPASHSSCPWGHRLGECDRESQRDSYPQDKVALSALVCRLPASGCFCLVLGRSVSFPKHIIVSHCQLLCQLGQTGDISPRMHARRQTRVVSRPACTGRVDIMSSRGPLPRCGFLQSLGGRPVSAVPVGPAMSEPPCRPARSPKGDNGLDVLSLCW